MLKRFLTFCVLLGFVLLFGWAGCSPAFVSSKSGEAPLSDQTERLYNFGCARNGATINHTFILKNTSKNTWHITGSQSSCGCTVVKNLRSTSVRAGGAIPVPVEMSLLGKQGRVASTVAINVENQQPIVFTLEGEVLAELPASVDFGKIKKGVQETRDFELTPLPEQPIPEILALHFDRKYFYCSALTRSRETLPFRVTLQSDIPYGYFNVPITIETNDSDAPTKSLFVKGYIYMPVEVSRRQLVFGDVTRRAREEEVKIWSPYEEELRAVDGTCEPAESFTWKLKTGEDESVLGIVISATASNRSAGTPEVLSGSFHANLTVGGVKHDVTILLFSLS